MKDVPPQLTSDIENKDEQKVTPPHHMSHFSPHRLRVDDFNIRV